MKKIFVTFSVILLILVNICPVSAWENEAVFEVTALGIIVGNGNGNLNLEKDVTRGEFATMIMRMLGYGDLIEERKPKFVDVNADYVHAGSIAMLAELGYVAGDGNGYFRPEAPITVQDCAKVLVSALGYSLNAENKGGYPNGYTAVANSLGLTKNLKRTLTQNATRADVVSMIHEALYADIIEKSYSEKNEYNKSGETLKDRLMQRDDVKHITGVVTADYNTWLVRPLSDIKENETEIGEERYICGNIDMSAFLGMTVEVYYREDNGGNKIILSMAETNKNYKVTVSNRDIDIIEKSQLIFHDSNTRKETVKLDPNVDYIYNGRMLTEYTHDDIVIESGRYECIDNNNDKLFDYVFIYEYENSIVDRVNPNGCIYLKNDLLISDLNYVRVDEDNDDYTFSIKDSYGEKITIDDIKNGDVVTVYKSVDGRFTEVVVSKNVITGTIEAIDEDNIEIDKEEYGIGSSLNMDDAIIGDEVAAYINEFNEVFYLQESENTEWKYGCIMGTEKKGISQARAKIIVSDLVKNDVETDEESEDEEEIPVLLCKNSEVIICDLESRIKFNGEKISCDDALVKMNKLLPIKFKLGNDGKLFNAEYIPCEYGSTVIKMNYNANDKTFGGISGILPFGINEETQVICAPENQKASDEDILSQIKIDNRDASVRYLASGYERDENTKCVKVLMIIASMDSDSSLNITKNSNIGMVQKSVVATDEMGFEEQLVTILTQEGDVAFKVKEVNDCGDTKYLNKGDFIIYEVNNEGYLVNSLIVKALGKNFVNNVSNRSNVNGCITGVVTEIEKNEINNEKNKRIHVITVQAGDEVYRVEFPVRNIPNFYVFDKEKRASRLGSIDDVMYGDIICVAMPEENVRDCVVLRGN